MFSDYHHCLTMALSLCRCSCEARTELAGAIQGDGHPSGESAPSYPRLVLCCFTIWHIHAILGRGARVQGRDRACFRLIVLHC